MSQTDKHNPLRRRFTVRYEQHMVVETRQHGQLSLGY